MIGDSLYLLHALRIGRGELLVNVTQARKQLFGETGQLGKRKLTQSYEILYLHPYTVANECILRKITGQGVCFSTVSAVNRRNGCQY